MRAVRVALLAILALTPATASARELLPGLAPTIAAGEACPGATVCPYETVAVTSERGNGVLRLPQAVAVSPEGKVFVADQYTRGIQRFAADGTFELTFGSFEGDDDRIGAVGGIAVGPDGTVYVLDASRNRVKRFTPDGRYLGEFGGGGRDVGELRLEPGRIPGQGAAGGIAVSLDSVWVADTGNDRVQRFDLDGTNARAFGRKGSGPGRFATPQGIAVRRDGAVYVADNRNHRIVVLNADGSYRRQIGKGR
ncbi:MAG: NHL repeat-containing protein, partial [Solirubrobacteraceae bacterium]